MREEIEIDERRLEEAMTVTGLPTKEATVEEALRRFVLEQRRRKAIENMSGMGWEGDLDAMRAGRD